MLKVSPGKGVVRFGKRGKLNPMYVGPFKVLEKVGKELPEELSRVHNTFHEPLEIVGLEGKRLKRSWIPLVKVRWNSKRGPEFTWEREDQIQREVSTPLHQDHTVVKCCIISLEDKAHLTGEVYNTLCFQVIDDTDKSTMYLLYCTHLL
ncbi:hypothetical protein Tco_0288351 [Tanacetum coccineum]